MLGRPYVLALLWTLVTLGPAACGPAGGPAEGRRLYTADLAPNPGSGLSNPDPDPEPEPEPDPACPTPTLSSLRDEVFLPLCSSCHSGTLAPEGLALDLAPTELLARLGQPAHGSPSGMPLIAGGRRGGSFLYLKVFLETPLAGVQMPKDAPALSDCQVEALGAWIDAGALP
ncbi:MAG: hypothetical protein IPG45_04860 [Deltaproteobacteria bacterium]|nr:hypothetical protein [Deltaproteobacteria bacterium]